MERIIYPSGTPSISPSHPLQEIENWQKEEDLAEIDHYYSKHGYKSYLGIVRLVAIKRGRRKVDAKFEFNQDMAGEYRFKLISPNGQTIVVSEGYTAKGGALNGIESVRENALVAVVDDKTT